MVAFPAVTEKFLPTLRAPENAALPLTSICATALGYEELLAGINRHPWPTRSTVPVELLGNMAKFAEVEGCVEKALKP